MAFPLHMSQTKAAAAISLIFSLIGFIKEKVKKSPAAQEETL